MSGETISAVKGAEGGVKLGGERKLVTVFFSDIRGFTAFSETREPEVVVDMLNTFLGEQAQIVRQYQGDIDKFVGDELVAVFQGDGMVERATRCAVDIQRRMAQLSREHPEWGIAIGIGINSGEVVMGAMGSESRMDYTILGDTVNLGARLCSNAGRGEILLSERAYGSHRASREISNRPPRADPGEGQDGSDFDRWRHRLRRLTAHTPWEPFRSAVRRSSSPRVSHCRPWCKTSVSAS